MVTEGGGKENDCYSVSCIVFHRGEREGGRKEKKLPLFWPNFGIRKREKKDERDIYVS